MSGIQQMEGRNCWLSKIVKPACIDSNGLKKGAWSAEEDNKLRAYIERYGHWNWRLLPKYAGLARCGKSCRLRWVNYLKPGLRKGNFSKQEQDLIVELHAQLGNKWSAIAAKLPGRTDNEIKNFWNTRKKKSGLNEKPATNNVNNQSSASSRDQALDKTPSEATLCITTLNESPSKSENPTLLSDHTKPSDLHVDSQVDFWQDTAYNRNDCFPPLLPEEEFSYSQLHYSELSNSNSSYPTALDRINEGDDISIISSHYVTQQVQEDFWGQSFVSSSACSLSENCNIWSPQVGGFYDPFLQYYDHGLS